MTAALAALNAITDKVLAYRPGKKKSKRAKKKARGMKPRATGRKQ